MHAVVENLNSNNWNTCYLWDHHTVSCRVPPQPHSSGTVKNPNKSATSGKDLLMLEVTKAVMLKVGKCYRLVYQNSNFVKMVTAILVGNKNKMNIECWKILEYPTPEKPSGWVSENILVLTPRLGMWLHSINNFLPLQNKYTDPITHEQ